MIIAASTTVEIYKVLKPVPISFENTGESTTVEINRVPNPQT